MMKLDITQSRLSDYTKILCDDLSVFEYEFRKKYQWINFF